ncbi:MAG: hypothetical protein ACLRZ9_02080 [Eubacterium sp.]
MGETKEYITYNVIDSIKGGCGKTTLAIILTEYLERYSAGVCGHACLLDMDFLGTGLVNLFVGAGGKEKLGDGCIYVTEKIRGYHADNKRYIIPMTIGNRDNQKILYVGFSDPDYRTKGEYRTSSKSNYSQALQYGTFRAGIKNVLEINNLNSQINGKVGSVILDMSPSVDTYSESVKDNLFDRKYSNYIKKDDKRNYFLLVGMDLSHIHAAVKYLKDFIDNNEKFADNIFIVFNDIMHVIDVNPSAADEYNMRRNLFEQALEKEPQKVKEKIHFLALNPYRKYQETVYGMHPLCEEKTSDIFSDIPTPFAFAGKYGNEMKEIDTYKKTDKSSGADAESEGEADSTEKIKEGEVFKWLMGKDIS